MTRVHMSFHTPDLAASTRFYAELFGAGPDKEREGYVRFQPADVPITLSMTPGQATSGAHHFGVKLASADAVKAAIARFERAGLPTKTEENTTCCFAVQDKVWVADPDGRAWEVYTVTDDLATEMRSDTTTCCADADEAQGACCG